MCILLYVKLMWCNGISEIYCELELWGVHVSSVYVQSALCGTYLVSQYSIHLLSIGEGYIYPQYMCILLYVKLIWCSNIPYIYSQLLWGRERCILSICAFCYMWNLFGVAIFHTSILNWCGGGIDVSSLYVHSAICETYLV